MATCPSTRAHWRHLANTIELVLPSAHLSPQSKRQMDRFNRFCTAYDRKCLYFPMGTPIHQNCPFPWKFWTAHVTRDAFGPSPLPSNRHHRSNDDCLEGKGENYQVCCVQYCVQQFTVQCTHIWTDLTVFWIGFCLTGSISLCLDSFLYGVLLCVVCMRKFVTRWGGPGGIEACP